MGLHVALHQHCEGAVGHDEALSHLTQAAAHGHHHHPMAAESHHEHEALVKGGATVSRTVTAVAVDWDLRGIGPTTGSADAVWQQPLSRYGPSTPLFTAHCSLLL
ncbi:MAG: hypothetical protein AAF657_04895 [Acidobacteriota bacterium]